MRIDIITAVPSVFNGIFSESILGRAQKNGIVEIVVHDLRNYTHDRHKTIDDVQYGGGPGMVLKPEPIFECIERIRADRKYDEIIYTTPDGEPFTQNTAVKFSLLTNIIILCGHYKGIDDRVRKSLITREISIGDYVLTGGELPSAVIVDAITRLLPGALHDSSSAMDDSFQDNLLGAPVYTRPPDFRGIKVPEVLLSGNHGDIEIWRYNQRLDRTRERRPDLFKKLTIAQKEE